MVVSLAAVCAPRAALRSHAVAALVLAVALSACGEERTIRIEPQGHDFGRVLQGRRPVHAFRITNGTERSIQYKAVANCACFAVSQEPGSVDPGASATFHVLFDTTALSPRKAEGKHVMVYTVPPEYGPIRIPLEGEIYRAYEVAPQTIRLGRIDGKDADFAPRRVSILPVNDYALHFEKAGVTPNIFDVEGREAPGGGLEVRIALRRGLQRPVGPLEAVVRLDLELVAPGGERMKEHPVVTVEGLWLSGG